MVAGAFANTDQKFFLVKGSAPHPLVAERGGADRKAKDAASDCIPIYDTQLVIDAFNRDCEKGILNPALSVTIRFLGVMVDLSTRNQPPRRR